MEQNVSTRSLPGVFSHCHVRLGLAASGSCHQVVVALTNGTVQPEQQQTTSQVNAHKLVLLSVPGGYSGYGSYHYRYHSYSATWERFPSQPSG